MILSFKIVFWLCVFALLVAAFIEHGRWHRRNVLKHPVYGREAREKESDICAAACAFVLVKEAKERRAPQSVPTFSFDLNVYLVASWCGHRGGRA